MNNVNKNLEIALINPFNKKIVLRDFYSSTISKGNYNWPNIDLLCMSGILSKEFKTQIIDANTLGLSAEEIVTKINNQNLKGIIFSIGKSVLNDDYEFIKDIKSKIHPSVRIAVVGGVIYHDGLSEIKKNDFIDACILNFTTNDVLNFFLKNYENLNNVIYRKNNEIFATSIRMPDTNFVIPVPSHEDLPLSKYQISHGRTKPLTSVITSYGCPHKCSFCVSGRINFRYRNIDNIIEELDYLHSIGVKEIVFRDNIFGFHKKSCRTLLEKMIERKYKFSWVSDSRVDILDEEMIKLMSESGCHSLHFGIESASTETLKQYDKNLKDIGLIEKTIRLCKKFNILSVGYFILGLPGETRDDVDRTINYAIKLNLNFASFNLPIPILGTELRENSIKNEWMLDNVNEYDGSSSPLIVTDLLSQSDLLYFKNKAYKKFYFRLSYIFNSLLRIKTFFQLKMLIIESINLLVIKEK